MPDKISLDKVGPDDQRRICDALGQLRRGETAMVSLQIGDRHMVILGGDFDGAEVFTIGQIRRAYEAQALESLDWKAPN